MDARSPTHGCEISTGSLNWLCFTYIFTTSDVILSRAEETSRTIRLDAKRAKCLICNFFGHKSKHVNKNMFRIIVRVATNHIQGGKQKESFPVRYPT